MKLRLPTWPLPDHKRPPKIVLLLRRPEDAWRITQSSNYIEVSTIASPRSNDPHVAQKKTDKRSYLGPWRNKPTTTSQPNSRCPTAIPRRWQGNVTVYQGNPRNPGATGNPIREPNGASTRKATHGDSHSAEGGARTDQNRNSRRRTIPNRQNRKGEEAQQLN